MSKLLDNLHKNIVKAFRKRDFYLAYELIKIGVDINFQDKDNNNLTFLMYALCYCPLQNNITEGGESVLPVTAYLIYTKSNLNLQTKYGNTVLMMASDLGYTQIILHLLQQKCNLDIQNKVGRTILMCAVANSKLELVEKIINLGCNLKLKNYLGETAFCIAKRNKKWSKNGEKEVKIFNIIKNKIT